MANGEMNSEQKQIKTQNIKTSNKGNKKKKKKT